MNQTLSTFLKIAVSALSIGLLLFGVAYGMVKSEGDSYKSQIENVKTSLPSN